MMQDIPKLFDSTAKVGFTEMERWICFSAVKNNLVDAAKKYKDTGVAESAASGEADMYAVHRRKLALVLGDRADLGGDQVKARNCAREFYFFCEETCCRL